MNSRLSRREFLQLSRLGAAGLLMPFRPDFRSLAPDQQGRVTAAKISLYDIPSFGGRELKILWKDTVVPISEVTVGDQEPPHNRIWYRIGEEGYAHSGAIQPVRTWLNLPPDELPADGALAEVTVPFTDSRWGVGRSRSVAYRFYFETTFWVTAILQDAEGEWWYRIPDDKWPNLDYYALAAHLRLIQQEELTPLSPQVEPTSKRLVVRLSEQVVVAYEGEHPVFAARAATGKDFSSGRYGTPLGRYAIFYKTPTRHMAAGDLASDGYDLPGVPWVCNFVERGVAFHGTYWHNDFGRPRSHGCVNLTPRAAKWIYRWTNPQVALEQREVYKENGTMVEVVL
jgi:hypothetical protein